LVERQAWSRNTRPRIAIASALFGFAAILLGVEAPEVSAHLEPDPLGLDELASFTLVVSGSGFGGVDVEPDFRLENLEIAGGPFRSTSQSWVNGVTSSTTQLVWRLRPLALGPARVAALRIEVDGELVQLPDVAARVVEQAPPRAAPRRPAQDPFGSLFGGSPFEGFERRRPRFPREEPKLRAVASAQPSRVWVGQQLLWQLLLDTQSDISRVEPREMPDFRGFWARDVTPDRTPPPQWIESDGSKFARVPILERALFPLQPGSLVLPKVEVAVWAEIVDADRFIPIVTPKLFELETRPVSVVARALPPPPADFSGVVGRLELAATLDRAEIESGQAASFSLSATSDGNLQSVEPPRLVLPDGLRSFPPTRESEDRILGGRLETTVRWRYVLLADRPGRYRLPASELVYFEPGSASYRSASAEAPELAVRAASNAETDALPEAPATAPATVVERTNRLAPLARGAGIVVAGAALAALAATLVARRRRAGRPTVALRAAIDTAAREPSARAAAAALEEAWRRFLAERWSIPRSMPTVQWRARLAAGGRSEQVGRELETLFEELHLLAFAPELAEVEAQRADVVARSRRLLRRLR
jgi:hypothetical protein